MIAKYTHVFMHASFEKINVNLVMSASNIFATNTDINWDAKIPIASPAINDKIPTSIVSSNIILDICLLPIPNVI